MNVLIVCSGNICRSPMAEAYLRHRLGQRGAGDRISSAGTLGIVGDRAASAAVAVLADEVGIDIRSHQTRGLSREEVEDADWILVMEHRHRRYLSTLYPAHAPKIRLLTDYAPAGSGIGRGTDIFDPVGMDLESFRACFRLIRTCLDAFAESVAE